MGKLAGQFEELASFAVVSLDGLYQPSDKFVVTHVLFPPQSRKRDLWSLLCVEAPGRTVLSSYPLRNHWARLPELTGKLTLPLLLRGQGLRFVVHDAAGELVQSFVDRPLVSGQFWVLTP